MANVDIIIKAIDATGPGLSKASKETIATFAKISAAVAVAGVAVKKAYDFGKEGANILRLEAAHEQLAGTAIDANNGILASLQRASMGTVANSDIILASNRAMMLGLGKDANKLGELMQVAAHRGRAMGLTTTQAFNDIVTGVGRASPLILDNLGIIVDSVKVYDEYATSLGKTSEELTKAEKTQALLNSVLEEGNRQIEEAGGLVDDTAGGYERLEASAKNYFDTLKKDLAPAIGESSNFLADWADAADESRQGTSNWVDALGPLGAAIRLIDTATIAWGEDTQDTTDFLYAGSTAIDGWASSMKTGTEIMIENAKSVDGLADRYEGILSITQSMQSGADSFNDKQEDTKERIGETLVEIQKATDEYGSWSDEVEELKNKHLELTASMSDNVKQFEEDTQKRILARAKELLSADGLTADEEKFLVEQGLALGVYTDSVAAKTLMVINDAEAIASAYTSETDAVVSGVSAASDALNALDGQEYSVTITANWVDFEGVGLLPGQLVNSGGGNVVRGRSGRPGGGTGPGSIPFLAQEILREIGG